MTLLAQYIRTHIPEVLDLQLLNIETKEPLHHITDQEADEAGQALIHLGFAWATQNGHEIGAIDSAILNINAPLS
jgi:hypothetical protein